MFRVHTRDEGRFMESGFSPLDRLHLASEKISATIATDPNTCPFAYSGCFGAKDSGFDGRCSGENLPYMDCELYQLQTNETQLKTFSDESSEDDDRISRRTSRKTHLAHLVGDLTIREAVDEFGDSSVILLK